MKHFFLPFFILGKSHISKKIPFLEIKSYFIKDVEKFVSFLDRAFGAKWRIQPTDLNE